MLLDTFLGVTAVQTWASYLNNVSARYGGYRYCTALNGFIEWNVWIGAGTYNFEALYATASDAGIATLSVDAVDVSTFDGYSSATIVNVKGALGPIVIAAAGLHTFRLTVKSRNASNTTGYAFYLQAAYLRRTA